MRDQTWDFSLSSVFALICVVILLFSFLFLPWGGVRLTDNGARLVSDAFSGAPGARPVPLLWLVPLMGMIAVVFAMWGALAPEKSRLATFISLGAGLGSLIYFISTLGEPQDPRFPLGLGFWASFGASIGMIVQVLMAMPPVVNVWDGIASGTGNAFKIPPKLVPYLFIAPALILYFVWIIAPTFYTIYLSMTNWDGITEPTFIGLENYIRLFTKDRTFTDSLWNNLRWLLIFITVPTTLGLAMALIFNQEMRGGKFFKVSFYSPLVLSLPVIGLIWSWVYNPSLGLINSFLMGIGVADPPGWLGDRQLAIWCVIAAAVWRQVGYVMVLYLAGLKNIDPQLVDAARVDGANRWNLFQHVIFPLLAPVTTIIAVISMIDSLRAFDLVAIMTRGGQNTQVLANFMYIEAFNNYRMGYGGAIAVVLFAISLVFIGFYLRQTIKDELEY